MMEQVEFLSNYADTNGDILSHEPIQSPELEFEHRLSTKARLRGLFRECSAQGRLLWSLYVLANTCRPRHRHDPEFDPTLP
jgi:hypothetical protein